MPNKKFWAFKALDDGKTAELYLYGLISSETWWGDEITPKKFKRDLDALGDIDVLYVYISSDGGDVFAGQTILSMLKRHRAKVIVYVDGLAASIASAVAMAGDRVIMPRNAMMMIHNPWTITVGNSAEMRKMADDLDIIRESIIAAYQDKTKMDREDLIALMNKETWMTAEEAVRLGFADEIDAAKQIAASLDGQVLSLAGVRCSLKLDLSRFQNAPKVLIFQSERPLETPPNEPTGVPEGAGQADTGLASSYSALAEALKIRGGN